MPVAGENLAARAHPFHRSTELARGQHHQRMFGVGAAAQAEGSPDVLGHDLDAAGIKTGDGCQRRAHAQHALGRGVNGEVLALRVVGRQARPQFHRRTDQALAVHAQRGGAGRFRECGVHRGAIAGFKDQADIAGMFFVQLRSALGERGWHRGDGRQFLVVHQHLLGGVACGHCGVGNHHRDRLADESHPVAGQQGQGGFDLRLAIGAGQRHAGRDIVKTGFGNIACGQHRDHAGRRHGAGRIDRDQTRVGAIRSDHAGMELAGQVPVSGVLALACDQSQIFMAGCDQFTVAGIDDRVHERAPWLAPALICRAAVLTAATMFT